ncbi:hypothetical protein A3D05_06280 [Candidatus Gottesmanbacteria bacterium RIFCSPHIGHO2_02_FULL_40_24]|uniref:Glycosyltransferase RgtA/B/C/D-like domain-containing protein n=1 Tax=Candidatus Gottesmanbacteria bacterium RIFCSPHIGHO2_01_FULL_40_15 TaxID=1798376 RepID=A0A1F5Z7Q8_9BACT|nr:MAG: hypothetical protein A2777_03155 [Candidatus Gottesmanbacteria bacterium RIFCSPHIGHO2_01_FULL_40_15]OGG18162.1 MAG: hypothetical protein A3D05_06280 [Candidatus Gottesmanbacteria bacterium RIFCSPHIGHO2_02_FULL_40_24]OGG21821.1 MAG: hypothetical protein A3B48_06400 [Candidatus Gottesmanbacteria bacterium RIFCSPLOWO2_01_FULL_40_10]OGG25467.1 MAG: hypothetical protein A3E42_05600 [Candidatus Gottesmanbacteria bacterium RIFCSPHIGHO2_12_FULL_40_13]OGG33861.1 MAG: hypothetical protein A3I80_0
MILYIILIIKVEKIPIKKVPLKVIFFLGYIITILILLKSVITGGIGYMYDIDELFHIQLVWLYAKGFIPFMDFFTIHSPLFHKLIVPFMSSFGFKYESVLNIRIIMSAIFIFRLIITFLIVFRLYSLPVALIFLPLFLLDPLSNFSAMQIRPDNLMMLFFILGLFFLVFEEKRLTFYRLFTSGLFFSLSVLTSLKIAPSVLLITVFLFFTGKLNKKTLLATIAGLILPALIFILYFSLHNLQNEMIQQLILDARTVNSAILNPGKLSAYFKPDNIYLYTRPGKPLLWYFLISLPILSLSGWLLNLYRLVKININRFQLLLSLIFIFQIFFTLSVRSVFIQYLLPVSWLASLYSAYLLNFPLNLITNNSVKKIYASLITAVLLILISLSVDINYRRAKYDNPQTGENLERLWRQIPENQYVYPNLLFRPPVYPLTYGVFIGDIPPALLSRFPKISYSLEKHQVKYLLVTEYILGFHPKEAQDYIRKNYQKDPVSGFWLRKN